MTCTYCGGPLVTLFNTPDKDLAWGGVLRCCPSCSGDFIRSWNLPTPPVETTKKEGEQ